MRKKFLDEFSSVIKDGGPHWFISDAIWKSYKTIPTEKMLYMQIEAKRDNKLADGIVTIEKFLLNSSDLIICG